MYTTADTASGRKKITKTFFGEAAPSAVFKEGDIVEVQWQVLLEGKTDKVKRWCEGKVTTVNAGIYTVEHFDKDIEGNISAHEVKVSASGGKIRPCSKISGFAAMHAPSFLIHNQKKRGDAKTTGDDDDDDDEEEEVVVMEVAASNKEPLPSSYGLSKLECHNEDCTNLVDTLCELQSCKLGSCAIHASHKLHIDTGKKAESNVDDLIEKKKSEGLIGQTEEEVSRAINAWVLALGKCSMFIHIYM